MLEIVPCRSWAFLCSEAVREIPVNMFDTFRLAPVWQATTLAIVFCLHISLQYSAKRYIHCGTLYVHCGTMLCSECSVVHCSAVQCSAVYCWVLSVHIEHVSGLHWCCEDNSHNTAIPAFFIVISDKYGLRKVT